MEEEDIEMTRLSSRGQVVIPSDIRESMNLKEGTKFAVLGMDDTILLKRMRMSGFEGFDKLVKEGRELAKQRKIKPKDLEKAIDKMRHKK